MELEQVFRQRSFVTPQQVAGLGVERNYLGLRRGDEHHTVIHYRRRLVPFVYSGRECPDRRQILGVARVDLVQRTVIHPIVRPPVLQPVGGLRIGQPLLGHRCVVLDPLGGGSHWNQETGECQPYPACVCALHRFPPFAIEIDTSFSVQFSLSSFLRVASTYLSREFAGSDQSTVDRLERQGGQRSWRRSEDDLGAVTRIELRVVAGTMDDPTFGPPTGDRT